MSNISVFSLLFGIAWGCQMKIKNRQVRRLYLTGTVAFPMPFPSVGDISFERAEVDFSPGSRRTQHFVVVQEKPTHNSDVERVIRIEDVSSLFFPVRYEQKDDSSPRLFFSDSDRVEDFDRGEWFFGEDVRVARIASWLNVKEEDLFSEEFKIRGIAFVPEDRPVISRTQVTEAAGATGAVRSGCDCCN